MTALSMNPTPTSSPTGTGRALAYFVIAYGGASLAAPLILRTGTGLTTAYWIALGLLSLAGGYFGLKGKTWAFRMILVLFLLQSVQMYTQDFWFSLVGPYSLKLVLIGAGPLREHMDLNLLAAGVAFFASGMGGRLTRDCAAIEGQP